MSVYYHCLRKKVMPR